MLNVNDLEIRYKKYKRKSFLPYLTLFLGLSAVSLSLFYTFSYYNTYHSDTNCSIHIETPAPEKKEQVDENKTKDEVVVVKEKILKLSPSLDFIDKMQSQTNMNYNSETAAQYKSPSKPVEKKIEVKEPKADIKIKREHEYDDIRHVIKRFEVNHSPALSLFIAKRYYNLGVYDKAYNYALITNEIDNNIEESWIIFAKSLIKLNKRDTAIKILTQYVNHSQSSQAKMLLDEIISGKFR